MVVAGHTETIAAPAVSESPALIAPPDAGTGENGVVEQLYLTGRPTVGRFIRFIGSNSLDTLSEGALVDEWRAASEVARKLEREEAGYADDPPIRKMEINPSTEPLLIGLLRDPLARSAFSTVPTDVAYVELDRLVVYQLHVDRTFAGELARTLGPAPTDEQLFRTCLPFDHPRPPVRWSRSEAYRHGSRTHADEYVFLSPSNDLRFLGTMPMEAEHIAGYAHPGTLAGVVGLAVGFGSNYLSAMYAENRLILKNGNHRAYALRAMGFTHAPCIIQHVSSREELEVVAASRVVENPDYFLKNPRPPVLKDYFDERLRRVVRSPKRLHQVRVRFEVEETDIPSF